MKDLFRLRTLAAACAAVLLIASCGSSNDDSPSPPPPDEMAQEDAAASASVAGFIAFIQVLIATMTLDTNEPRNIGAITPPLSETAEPAAI